MAARSAVSGVVLWRSNLGLSVKSDKIYSCEVLIEPLLLIEPLPLVSPKLTRSYVTQAPLSVKSDQIYSCKGFVEPLLMEPLPLGSPKLSRSYVTEALSVKSHKIYSCEGFMERLPLASPKLTRSYVTQAPLSVKSDQIYSCKGFIEPLLMEPLPLGSPKLSRSYVTEALSVKSHKIYSCEGFMERLPLGSPKLSRSYVTELPGTDPPKYFTDFSKQEQINALSGILHQLKNVTKPRGKYMFPYVRPETEYKVLENPPDLDEDFIYELNIDVWPIPYSWIIHGIWPGFVKGETIVYYIMEDMDVDSYRILKEAVKKEILELDDATREILHTVWRSYSESKMSKREQDIDFWAHEKIKHCWDLVTRPKDGFFKTLADLGDYVRTTLLTWTSKKGFHPNKLYQTRFIRKELQYMFKVKVFLVAKRDDDKKVVGSTRVPYITGLAMALKPDQISKYGACFVDHPSASTKISAGWIYFLQ